MRLRQTTRQHIATTARSLPRTPTAPADSRIRHSCALCHRSTRHANQVWSPESYVLPQVCDTSETMPYRIQSQKLPQGSRVLPAIFFYAFPSDSCSVHAPLKRRSCRARATLGRRSAATRASLYPASGHCGPPSESSAPSSSFATSDS